MNRSGTKSSSQGATRPPGRFITTEGIDGSSAAFLTREKQACEQEEVLNRPRHPGCHTTYRTRKEINSLLFASKPASLPCLTDTDGMLVQ